MTTKRPMTKERLQRYANLVQEIDRQFEALEIMEEKLTSPKSSNLTGMPRSTASGSFDRMSMAIAKKEDMEQYVKALLQKERQEAQAIEEAVQLLEEPNERQVIRLRYVDGFTWTEVCRALFGRRKDYEERLDTFERRTYKIHGKALINLEAVTTPPEDERSEEAQDLPKI